MFSVQRGNEQVLRRDVSSRIEAPNAASVLAWMLAAGLLAFPVTGQSATTHKATYKVSPYLATQRTHGGKYYYGSIWGVDHLKVKEIDSGDLIKFTFRIVDPAKAQVLVDRNEHPYLYSPRSRALLRIPMLEKVGPLRQGGKAVAGHYYWMTFSNNGHPVKHGDRVDVLVGTFRANGLMVE